MVIRLKNEMGLSPTQRDNLVAATGKEEDQPVDKSLEPYPVSELPRLNVDEESPSPPAMGEIDQKELGKVVPSITTCDIQQQVLQIMQSTRTKVDINSKALERAITKLSEDLGAVMADISQHSTVQTHLLHTLVGDPPAGKPSTSHSYVQDKAIIPMPATFTSLKGTPANKLPTTQGRLDARELDTGAAGIGRPYENPELGSPRSRLQL